MRMVLGDVVDVITYICDVNYMSNKYKAYEKNMFITDSEY